MDPPYYDNVSYAKLADYYYVWQKRVLADLYPGWFDASLTNKDDEAIADSSLTGSAASAKQRNERLMQAIYAESRRVLRDDGLLTLMFTHKGQDA